MFTERLVYKLSTIVDPSQDVDNLWFTHDSDICCRYTRFKSLSVLGLEYKPYIIDSKLMRTLSEATILIPKKNEKPDAFWLSELSKTAIYGDLDLLSVDDIKVGTDITMLGLLLMRFGRWSERYKISNQIKVKLKYLKPGDLENNVCY